MYSNYKHFTIKRPSKLVITCAFTALTILAGALAITLTLRMTNTAYAATPSDSCFAFNAGTGTITDYYDNEDNNASNPACPRAVDIPSTIGGVEVTTIGDWAFDNNQITSVTIPNSVTEIGKAAFQSNQLTTIILPDSVVSIGNYAFNLNILTSLTIPNSVASIGNSAFAQNDLTTVTVLGDPTTIEDSVIAGNPISTIVYNGTTYTENDPITEVCYMFDTGTGAITSLIQADLSFVKTNGQACLNKDIAIPSTIGSVPVVSIGDNAFLSKGLTSVSIPDSVTSIGVSAFSSNQITSVIIGDSVTSIGSSAFAYNQLTSVTIPNSVTTIGDTAFVQNKLSTVSIAGNPTLGTYAFALQGMTVGDDGLTPNLSGVLATVLYAPNMTTPPSSEVLRESDLGGDVNGNGTDADIVSVLVVNPASLTVQYHDENGADIHSPVIFYGDDLSGTILASTVEAAHPGFAAADLSSIFYLAGSSVTQIPPAIAGYTTPAAQTTTLSTGTNNMTFIYASTTAGNGDDGGTDGNTDNGSGSGASDADDDILADTGANRIALIKWAIVLIFAASSLIVMVVFRRTGKHRV